MSDDNSNWGIQTTTGGHKGLACRYDAGVLATDFSKHSTPKVPEDVWAKAEERRKRKAKLAGGTNV